MTRWRYSTHTRYDFSAGRPTVVQRRLPVARAGKGKHISGFEYKRKMIKIIDQYLKKHFDLAAFERAA